MIIINKKCIIKIILFLVIQLVILLPIILLHAFVKGPAASLHQTITISSAEKRGTPSYDKIIEDDGLPHYRVFFWVPKTADKFVPYADKGVKTDVSSHGPVEKWSVVQTEITSGSEKLVFIFVPKTFVYLYGIGFEKVIHLNYN